MPYVVGIVLSLSVAGGQPFVSRLTLERQVASPGS